MAWPRGAREATGVVIIIELLFLGENVAATRCIRALQSDASDTGVHLQLVTHLSFRISSTRRSVAAVWAAGWQ